jgi:hypothetical protein
MPRLNFYARLGIQPDSTFDTPHKFVTSPIFRSPILFASIRLTIALYTATTLLVTLIWKAVVTHDAKRCLFPHHFDSNLANLVPLQLLFIFHISHLYWVMRLLFCRWCSNYHVRFVLEKGGRGRGLPPPAMAEDIAGTTCGATLHHRHLSFVFYHYRGFRYKTNGVVY